MGTERCCNFPEVSLIVSSRGISAVFHTAPLHYAGQCLPGNGRVSLASKSETGDNSVFIHLTTMALQHPVWASLNISYALCIVHSALCYILGINRCMRHRPCPPRSQSGKENNLVDNEHIMYWDMWHSEGRCQLYEHIEKTGINFLFLCQEKWKANQCVMAESIYFY